MGSEIKPGELDRSVPGPQVVQGGTFGIEAGEETGQEGEYACDDCGKKARLEKKIIVPRCPDCGGESFHWHPEEKD